MTDFKHFQAAASEMEAAGKGGLSQSELDELVASSDTGGRSPSKPIATLLMLPAIAWSLFHLWIASPLPFALGFGVFNDTDARSVHLAFALFLAFAAYPAARTPFQLGLGLVVPTLLTILFVIGSVQGGTTWWWIPIVGVAVIAAIVLGSPKDRIPIWEWGMALLGAATSLSVRV